MKRLSALALTLVGAAFVFYFPERWLEALLAAGLAVVLTLLLAARNRIREKGGFRLWLKLAGLRLRPALTSKAKNRKAQNLGRVNAAIDKIQIQRRRETDRAKEPLMRQEVRKIGAAMTRLGQQYTDYSFVDFYFIDNGACFCITDDQPYPHQDIYAIYADIHDHRRFCRKIHYCVRKGQVLEDKEVFPAHIPPTKFTNLKKAGKALNKELRTVIGKIASRATTHGI